MLNNYVICTTQRSGSTFFCEYLASTGALGLPREWLVFTEYNPTNIGEDQRSMYYKPVKEIVSAQSSIQAKQSGQTVNGWKVMWSTMRCLQRRLTADGGMTNSVPDNQLFAVLEMELNEPKYVLFERSNKLAQAISHVIMQKTGVSHVETADQALNLEQKKELLKISTSEITSNVSTIIEDEAAWSQYFIENRIQPLRIIYEEFCQDIKGTIDRVADFVGTSLVNVSIDPSSIALRRTRSQLEDNLARDYLSQVVSVMRNKKVS